MMIRSLVQPLRHYRLALVLTLLAAAAVVLHSGLPALWPVLVLAVIEITFSFDNAVLNSEVLSRMSKVWRTVFLTVGIAIAVFGVRLILPLVLVSSTTGTGLGSVLDQALHRPDEYAQHLHEAYPLIAAFGGVFLLMIGLRFLAEDREVRWVRHIEQPIAALKQPWLVPIGGACLTIAALWLAVKPGDARVAIAALSGAFVFLVMKSVSALVETRQGGGGQNWVNFLYLELLDASFSFDGVIAAFAITKDVLLIAAGLGIGALYVRSATVHLLESGSLNDYRYLIHGAHYAIAALGVILIASIQVEIPEAVTGFLSVAVIGLAFYSSVRHNRQQTAGQSGYL